MITGIPKRNRWENKPANASYEIQMIQAGIDFRTEDENYIVERTLPKIQTCNQMIRPVSDAIKVLINEQMANLL